MVVRLTEGRMVMKWLDPVLVQYLGRPVWGCSSFRKGFRMCASRKGRG